MKETFPGPRKNATGRTGAQQVLDDPGTRQNRQRLNGDRRTPMTTNRAFVKTRRFSIDPVPPFRLDLTVWALRRRPNNAVDCWDGDTYQRVLVLSGRPVLMSVTQHGRRLHITVCGEQMAPTVSRTVTALLDRLLGLSTRLDRFYTFAKRDRRLNELAQRYRGLKPPRFPTLFEALVNGIACQQLSLSVGILLLNRLAERFGRGFDGIHHAFPRPEELYEVPPTGLRPLGYSLTKSRALLELARSVTTKQVDLVSLAGLDDHDAVARLCLLRGIGRWTAEYALLRGLGRIHLFPGDDVGARHNLQRWLHLRRSLDYQAVHQVLRQWRPYNGLVYFHLLLDHLDHAGCLT